MQLKTASAIATVLLALCGCITQRSRVADTLGYPCHSSTVNIGPYQVHYGTDGKSDFLLVSQGTHNLYELQGTNISTFVGGRSFLDVETDNHGGAVARFTIQLRDADGSNTITLVSDRADGIIDHKIDHRAMTIADWKDGRWVER